MHAQWSGTINKETLTSPNSKSSAQRRNAKMAKNTVHQKGKSFYTCGAILQELSTENDKMFERNKGASDDSLERFAVANQDKRSDEAPVKKVKNTKSPSIISEEQ